jgi:hypothetical protein
MAPSKRRGRATQQDKSTTPSAFSKPFITTPDANTTTVQTPEPAKEIMATVDRDDDAGLVVSILANG